MKATIKTLATTDDIADFVIDIRKSTNDFIKWMFIFWIGQIGATLAILSLILKK